MSARVLRGTKQEIAAAVARMTGEVREAIVFVDDPAPPTPAGSEPPAGDVFAEMQAFLVDVADVDDSREAIYSRMDGGGRGRQSTSTGTSGTDGPGNQADPRPLGR